jgi:RNA polymerase sigma-70 factor (ECF subfamily)
VLAAEFADVLRAAARGDEEAFARLYRDAQPRLLRYLRVVVGSAAEDVAADTWLDVARGLGRFRGDEAAFRAWLFTVARRRGVDAHRRAGRLAVQPVADPAQVDPRVAPDAADVALAGFSTEEALALIGTLPRDQAEAILLRVIGGLDVARTAAILGKSPGAVRVAAHRGLRTLAARLAPAERQV